MGYDKPNGLVRIEFGKPVAWLAMPRENAVELAKAILRHSGARRIDVIL